MADAIPAAKLLPSRMYVPNVLHGLGVVGGIPARTDPAKVFTLTASPGDNITAELQALVSATPVSGSNNVYKIPAGTFLLDTIYGPTTGGNTYHGDFTIRGSGIDETILTTSGSIYFGGGPDFNYGVTDVVSGMTKDSTSVVVVDSTFCYVGKLARIKVPNDLRQPIFSTYLTDRYVRTWTVLMTAVNYTTHEITFTPPIPEDLSDVAAYTGVPIIFAPESDVGTITGVGIEDMTIDKSAVGSYGVSFNAAANCWVKGVKVLGTSGHGNYFTNTVNCEWRENWIGATVAVGTPSNGSGLLVSNSSNCWLENNVFYKTFPSMEFWIPNMNCVVSYNIIPEAVNGNAFNIHNSHSAYIMFEGNIAPNIQSDSYFGGNSRIGLLRNWFTGRHGLPGASTETFVIDLQMGVRQSWVAGNLLRSPGFTNPDAGYTFGKPFGGEDPARTVQPSLGVWWYDLDQTTCVPKTWTGTIATKTAAQVGTVTFATAVADDLEASFVWNGTRVRGFGTNFGPRIGDTYAIDNGGIEYPEPGNPVTFYPGGAGGFRKYDLDVAATNTKANNYNFYDNAIPVGEQTTDTVPESLIYSSKPAWFGNKRWPLFDTADSATIPTAYDESNLVVLPAAHRFFLGNSSYLNASGTANVTTLNVTTLVIA